jgi:signal recognition particle subunit SEC65
MSSDLPSCESHRDATAMARFLVTFMDNPDVIREAILRQFRRVPTERTIREMRAKHLAHKNRPPEAACKPHEGYYPRDAADSLTKTNAAFLARLEAERADSRWRRANPAELNSTYLTQPALVDRKWDEAVKAI